MIGLFGAMQVAGAFTGRYQLPAFSGWHSLLEGMAWFGMGLSAWRANPTHFRRSLALLMIVRGIGVVGYAIWGSSPGLSAEGIVKLVTCLGVGIGIWTAREWARRACIVLGLLYYGYTLSLLAFAFTLFEDRMPPDRTMFVFMGLATSMMVAPGLALAIYGVIPSTQKHFAEARELIARSRVPARPR